MTYVHDKRSERLARKIKASAENAHKKRRQCKSIKAVFNPDGSPKLNAKGQQVYRKEYEKIPPVKVRFKRYLDRVRKIEVKDDEKMQELQSPGSGEGQAPGPTDGTAGRSEDSHGAVQADNGSGKHDAREADAHVSQDGRAEREDKRDNFTGEGTV